MTDTESFFDILKDLRKSQNIEIAEIHEFTKINPKYIEAIENGDFNILPNVYMRLFLRAYANFIGADSPKALKDFELYTTGKLSKSEKLSVNDKTNLTSTTYQPDSEIDLNPQISPKQILSGTIIIIAILILLWWAGKVTQEQNENVKLKISTNEIRSDTTNLKLESNSSRSDLSNLNKINKDRKLASLLTQSPLNNNDFLSEKFDTSTTITNFSLTPPYKFSIQALEENKIHISIIQNNEIIELVNQVVPKYWNKTFEFESTINFDLWRGNHIKVKMNDRQIDQLFRSDKKLVRGSYEANKSQLYLSFYNY